MVKNNIGNIKKLNYKDVGLVYGGELLGWTFEAALNRVDALRPEGVLGQPLSFWGNIAGALGGAVGAMHLPSPMNLLSALVGGYLATGLVDQVVTMANPIVVKVVTTPPASPAVFIPTGATGQFNQRKGYVYDMRNMGMQNVSVKVPVVNGGRYTV